MPLTRLLEMAGPREGAAALVLNADDGYTAEMPMADAQACQDRVAASRSERGFDTVIPGRSGKLQVEGIIEIQVK